MYDTKYIILRDHCLAGASATACGPCPSRSGAHPSTAAAVTLQLCVREGQNDLKGDFACSAVGALIARHPKSINQALGQPEGHHLRYGQGQPLQTWQGVYKDEVGGVWWLGGGGGSEGEGEDHSNICFGCHKCPAVHRQVNKCLQLSKQHLSLHNTYFYYYFLCSMSRGPTGGQQTVQSLECYI